MSEPAFDLWTDEQCMKLKTTWDLCRARRDSHHIAYRFYSKYNTVVSLPPILIGAILSTISFNPDAVPSGVSAGLAMFITAMSTINSFFGLSKSQEGHRQSYRFFNALVREIEMNIIRGKEAPKRSFIDFMEFVNSQFSKAVEDAPTLNPAARRVLDEYRNNRVSPFDELLKGNKEATGYDKEMQEEGQPSQPASATAAGPIVLNQVSVEPTTASPVTVQPSSATISTSSVPSYGQLAASLTSNPSAGQRREFTALKQTFETNNTIA